MFSLVYFILYINDVLITNTANNALVTLPAHVATINNLCLLLLFGLQHSIMARPKFKQWLKKYLDPTVERATFCLSTSIVLIIICLYWAPMNGQVWSFETNWIAYSLQGFAAFGWLMLVLSSFNIDHFELFGIRQVYCLLVNKPMPNMSFKVRGFYKWVRHPIQTGLLIGMWSVPHSSMTHFTLATGFTIYVFVGLYFEEKDLIREFGQKYLDYKERVGGLLPKVFNIGK
jgi:protein-S-isoprenylcysteine O-methyltransferase Ste14